MVILNYCRFFIRKEGGCMEKIALGVLLVLLIIVCSNLNKNHVDDTQTLEFFAMDTYVSLTASGVNATETLFESKKLIRDYENMMSHTIETSEVYRLNRNNGEAMQVSEEMYSLVETAVEYAKLTAGVFDPTIASVTALWEFNSSTGVVPSREEVDFALESVSYENIHLLDDSYIRLDNNATIEFGAIGKGIVTDLLYELYRKNSITSGIISLAGNVYLVGEKSRNTPWTVGITDPENPTQQGISVQLSDVSVVTAGAYERCFWLDGEFYHHIIDSRTGYPTRQDITSVTVISQNSTLADVYSTVLFAMGFEPAINFLAENTYIKAIIINSDNQVFISEDIQNSTQLIPKFEFPHF